VPRLIPEAEWECSSVRIIVNEMDGLCDANSPSESWQRYTAVVVCSRWFILMVRIARVTEAVASSLQSVHHMGHSHPNAQYLPSKAITKVGLSERPTLVAAHGESPYADRLCAKSWTRPTCLDRVPTSSSASEHCHGQY
jgi:hypothetical protein